MQRLECTQATLEMMDSPMFHEWSKGSQEYFTRSGKMSPKVIITLVLNRAGSGFPLETARAMERIESLPSFTPQALYMSRLKFNPEAIRRLNDFHASQVAGSDGLQTFKGYLLIAIDASDVTVPTTPETLDEYGNSSKKGVTPQAALTVSCAYDVLNQTIVDCRIGRYKTDETRFLEAHQSTVAEFCKGCKTIEIGDRGYPSMAVMLHWNREGQKYVVRLKNGSYAKERDAMGLDDGWVDIEVTPQRVRSYKDGNVRDELREAGTVRTRIVNVTLPNGEIETLATNLTEEEASADEMSWLYSRRWEIEGVYDLLKNTLEMENFTGAKPGLIEQDIYASVFLCNAAFDLITDAQADGALNRIHKSKHELACNRTFAAGRLKDWLGRCVLDFDRALREECFEMLVAEARREVVPIRKDRSCPIRKKKKKRHYLTKRGI